MESKNYSDLANFTSNLKGAMTAIATPFTADSSQIDYESLDKLIEAQIKGGITGLIVAGSTGEAATLSDVEYGALIRYVADRVDSRALCIAGVGSSSTQKACDLAIRATDGGADGLLVVSPPYNKPTQAGIIKHVEAVYAATSKPIIAYNVPGRAVSKFEPDTLKTLFDSKIIVGLKEAVGSIDSTMEIIAKAPSLSILSGDDSLTVPMMSLGAKGVISVASNLAPALVTRMCNFALAGDYDKARGLHFELFPLFRAVFAESNPMPVKMGLKLKGIFASAIPRLPLTEAQASTRELLEAIFNSKGIE